MLTLLLIGNSYTFYNDLDALVAPALQAGVPAWSEVDTARLANPGWTLRQHADEVLVEDSPHHALLVGDDAGWQLVMLQEQSQTAGFPTSNGYYQDSLAAVGELGAVIDDQAGEPVLLMTWGRRDGDSTNPALFPDFSTMNALLEAGFLGYAESLSDAGLVVHFVPAGRAFAQIYDAAVDAGEDPHQGDFFELYSRDGSHPSPAGSYLVACAAVPGLTGRSAATVGDVDQLDPDLAARLRAAADIAVLDDPFGAIPYPWAMDWPDGGAAAGQIAHPIWRPTVRVSGDVGAAGDLALGGDDGAAGRLWLVDGGALSLTSLTVSVDSAVELVGGALTVDGLTVDEGGGVSVRGGTLALTGDSWVGAALRVESGLLDLSGALQVADDFALGADGALFMVAGAHPLLAVEGSAALDGALTVASAPGDWLVLTAGELGELPADVTLPDGGTLERVDGDAGVELWVHVPIPDHDPSDDTGVDGDSGEPTSDDDTGAPAEDAETSGCGCSAGGAAGWAGVWTLALGGLALRRRR